MIRKWLSLRLHIQLAVSGAILLAITISITTWLHIQSQQQTLIENTTREATSLAKTMSIVGAYLVITNKLDQLESLLVQSTSFPIVTRARVISKNGSILSHVKKLSSGKIVLDFSLHSVTTPREIETVKTNINWDDKKLIVWQPITTSTHLGWINVDISLIHVISLINQTIFDNIVSACLAIMLDLIILLLILYKPANSLKRVIGFANKMTHNPGDNLDIIGGSYEINSLVAALNKSSLELAQQNDKIQVQAEDLIQLNKKQALLQMESEQRVMLDSMIESVITINEDGKILTFNNAAQTLFGYNMNEAIGKCISILMPPNIAHEHSEYINRYLAGGEPKIIGIGRNVEGKRKNNEIFPMQLSVAELPKDINGKRRFIGSCQDITLTKQQEEHLRQNQKLDALSKLTGGIAHDYNNLLAIILGYAELLKENLTGDLKLTKYANEVYCAAERGAKLTKKILGFSKYRSLNPEVLNLNILLQDFRLILGKIVPPHVEVNLALTDNLWNVKLDGGDFEDSIINISLNAIHAMDKGGQLNFKTKNIKLDKETAIHLHLPAGEYVLLVISDTGVGMDEATKEKIFDPFFTTKGDFGVGLGLSQVYGFMEHCNGRIKVDSSPQNGSQFSLYFPRNQQSLIYSQETHIVPASKSQGSEKILVVDDESAMRSLACNVLKPHGYQVYEANDAKQALKLLKSVKIDLMITDVIMPGMNGYALADKVSEFYPETKIQIVTGFVDDQQFKSVNSDLHKNRLYKPYSSKILLERLRELLDTNSKNSRNTLSV